MNLSRRVSISALLWALAAIASHADVKDLPVRKVNGKLYHYYEVPAKETVYSLCYKLGITKDQLVKDNPAVADGLKSGMTLFFPHESENSENTKNLANPGRIINHKVEKGETIYGIARKYGTSTDRILNDNPILQAGLKAGQTITIKTDASATAPASVRESEVESNKQSTDSQNSGTMNAYIVKKKETFYSIAHAHGITVAQLEAANPGVISLKAGQVLNIPGNIGQTAASNDMIAEEKQQPTSDFNTTTSKEQDKQSTISDNTLVETPDSVTAQKSDKHISIAVMLPFMLKEENPSKVALRCTEFYKGLLIAADSLRNTSASIHIKAFDTEGSTLTVRETLSSPDFGEFDYIIAPDNSEQLSVLGEWSRKHNAKVLNGFIVRNDSYITNPGMMQGNLPSPMMIEKAVEGMSERLRYST
ncbi:MAG: LysM peptidoglycan-binding domain-containing protein, partial [Duncaniella sp.]|nr:LysM peptidoglycan-binding domain-containing protein [Duncaniella sp.]